MSSPALPRKPAGTPCAALHPKTGGGIKGNDFSPVALRFCRSHPGRATRAAGVVKAGVIRLAQVKGIFVIPIYATADRAWYFKSWDRFMLPKAPLRG